MDGRGRDQSGRPLGFGLFALVYLVWVAVFLYLAVHFLLDLPFWMVTVSVVVFTCLPLVLGALMLRPSRRQAQKGRLEPPFLH